MMLPLAAQSLDYEKQFENDQVRVSKIAMAAGEKVGLHRDENPRIVIGLKGGTVKRLEQDGSTRDIHFPTGSSVFLEADPLDQLHRVVNASDAAIEIIVIELKEKE